MDPGDERRDHTQSSLPRPHPVTGQGAHLKREPCPHAARAGLSAASRGWTGLASATIPPGSQPFQVREI
jgi:hypothetical protein